MSQYIVLDLEWNQSAVGKEGALDRLPFEIIEIGAVKLNSAFQIISEFHKLIRPRVYKQMHYKISEVTHMSMNELDVEGEMFEDAVNAFVEWCGEDYIFCTWGSMDLTELQRNMVYHGLEIPFERPLFYYDLQKLYSRLYGDDIKRKDSLDTAVEQLDLLEDRPFHRALDDAYYTGKVMAAMDFPSVQKYISVDYYRLPETRDEELFLEFPDYTKYVSRTFDTKEDAIAQKTVTDMACLHCHRLLRKKVRWFSFGQKFYFCLAYCPEHGYVKGKIRMKKAEDGSVFVVKTVKMADEEGVKQILHKKEEQKKKRNEKNKQRKETKKKEKLAQ